MALIRRITRIRIVVIPVKAEMPTATTTFMGRVIPLGEQFPWDGE